MNQYLRALYFITESLSSNTDEKVVSSLRAQIVADYISWEHVVELANNHLLSTALWAALRKNNLIGDLPEDLVRYLQGLYSLNSERNSQLREQLLEAVKALNAIGIEPVLLKGAAHLVLDIYVDPSVRIMSDIDLLFEPCQVDEAYSCLVKLGYKHDDMSLDDYGINHHHLPPLFRPEDYATLEIHRNLMEGYAEILSTSEVLKFAVPIELNGLSMKMLSPTHRILHNIIHCQLIDRHYMKGVMPLRSLHEAMIEGEYHSQRIDWPLIVRKLVENGKHRVIYSYLFMANKLFNVPFPEGIQPRVVDYLYYLRCCGQLAWEWLDRWVLRLGRFSSEYICRTYHCEADIIALNKARLKHFMRLSSGYLSRKISCKVAGRHAE